jgi:integrase/recombinase XerD
MAKTKCISVPEKVHPHLFRHASAIHLYRSGMPLPLLSEFMGHADVQTTTIYAYADTEMPAWQNDEDFIRRLYGLK